MDEFAPSDALEQFADAFLIIKRHPSGDDCVERGSQAVNIARRPQLIQVPGGLLRTHKSRSADRRAVLRWRRTAAAGRLQQAFSKGGRWILLTGNLRQSPVNDQSFPIPAK